MERKVKSTPKKGKSELTAREKRRLRQLGACLLIAVVVFTGRGAILHRLGITNQELLHQLGTDVDFKGAFSRFGSALGRGEPVAETLSELALEVFSASPEKEGTLLPEADEAQKSAEQTPERVKEVIPPQEFSAAESAPGASDAPLDDLSDAAFLENSEPYSPDSEAESGETASGGSLSRDAAAELGLDEIVTPVMGTVSSGFGVREHPISGEEKVHNGVDLAVNTGTPILAFADGTVEYIGESPAYGLYTRLQHKNGVTSFYAHCDTLCIKKGQAVTAGQEIGKSGASGQVTGPHLHFELRKNGEYLDPTAYLETR